MFLNKGSAMQVQKQTHQTIDTLHDLAQCADYSLVETLSPDPHAKENGVDHHPREVFSGHYVPVNPTPIENPLYIAHSKTFFKELGLSDDLARSEDFIKLFSGDTSQLPEPLQKKGGRQGMHSPSTELSTTSSALLKRETATVTVEPYRSLKLS